MKKISITFFTLIILSACSAPKTETKAQVTEEIKLAGTNKPGPITIHDISRFPDIQNQTSLPKIVAELENQTCVNEKGIGFAGEYTRTYALYERMRQLATEPQLFSFLKNKSVVLRVYAFRALKELKYSSANSGKAILDNDTNKVCWFSGCIKTDTTVSFFSRSEE